jgi:hypothetical protein
MVTETLTDRQIMVLRKRDSEAEIAAGAGRAV